MINVYILLMDGIIKLFIFNAVAVVILVLFVNYGVMCVPNYIQYFIFVYGQRFYHIQLLC